MIAAGEADSDSVRRGIHYLCSTQRGRQLGRSPFTGTGFPKVFYLKYHMYRLYFPLMALARYKRAISAKSEPSAHAKVQYDWPPIVSMAQ